MRFDPQKLADLVDEESRLKHALTEVSKNLTDLQATDKKWDDERTQDYDRGQLQHAQLTRELQTVRAERQRYELQKPAAAKLASVTAFARWLRGGETALEAHERETYLGEITDGTIPGGGGQTFRLQAASASDATSGEEAVQEEIPPRLIDRLAFFGGVARMAQQFLTGTGGDYRIMQMDAASQEGEILADQNTAVTALDLPNIGIQTFGAKTASSKPILLTRELLQDAVFDIQTYVERQAVRRMGRIWNKAFTATQTGTGLPVGVVSSATAGITAAAAAAITWTELTNLIYAVNRAYREAGKLGEGGFGGDGGGMLGYMLSDDAEKAMRVLVDSDGRPLWVPSTREGAPSMLNGYPYVVNGHMDSVAAGKVPILFGNFSYYGIRTVQSVEIFRFMDSRTMQKNTIECLAFSRRDARPMGAIVSSACEAYAKLTMKAA